MSKIPKPGLLILCTVIALGGTSRLRAQEFPTIRLSLSPQLMQGLQVVYLSDLDLLDMGVADYVCDVSLYNVSQDWEDTRFILNVLQGSTVITSAETDPFLLPAPDPLPPPGSPSYTANNIELLNMGTFPGSNIHFEFHKTLDIPDDDFETYLFKSGRLERGSYMLQAILDNPAWAYGDVKAELQIHITNPSLIYLQYPRDRDVIGTEYPFFQYESDGTDFVVFVHKRRNPDDDVETVLSGHPTLEYHTPLKQFSYQMTDGDPLEPGATYFWYVKVQVFTSHGLEEFASPVQQFTIDTEAGLAIRDIRLLLEPLLGDQAEEIADDLSGFNLQTIRLNGETITLADFFELIAYYQENPFEIEDLELQ
jgi:hypothetical protein